MLITNILNDVNNIKSSIEFVNREGKNSQGTICYTTSPVHNEQYWLDVSKKIEDLGATSLAIKDMAGLLRPNTAYELIKKLKKNLKIPVYLHTHSTTGLADATNFKAYEAGVDNKIFRFCNFNIKVTSRNLHNCKIIFLRVEPPTGRTVRCSTLH